MKKFLTRSSWQQMSPSTARLIGWILYCAAAGWAWHKFWPEGWEAFSQIFEACAPLIWWGAGGIIGATIIEVTLLECFGKRDKKGRLQTREDPIHARLERIDNAIHNLYGYVQELDPELAEERELEEEFYQDRHMLAGMNHMEYVDERRAKGKRTLNDGFIYKTPQDWLDEQRMD